MMKKKIKPCILFFGLSGLIISGFFILLMSPSIAFAQDFVIDKVSNALNGSLSVAADPRLIVGRLIQIALSFLGVIAIVLIMYAGFIWTTSGGEEEKIDSAKKILRNAIIGLAIIISSWAIATYVLTSLMAAIGGGGGANIPANNNIRISSGAAALGSCTVDTLYPSNGAKEIPRNTSLMVTFKEDVNLDGLCVNDAGVSCTCNNTTCRQINPEAVQIYKSDLGNACATTCPSPNSNTLDVSLNLSNDHKTLILTPLSPLGSSDDNTDYSVRLTNKVKKIDGSSMFKNCGSDFLYWSFAVSNRLDLTPPEVLLQGIFPLPDNEGDISGVMTPASSAEGEILVNNCPTIYSAASVINIAPNTATVILDYHGSIPQFKISVPSDVPDKAQLFDNDGNLLGVSDFDSDGQIIFKTYLTLTAVSHPAGSSWTVNINPEQLADTLTVGSEIYTFARSMANNNIFVPGTCNIVQQAVNIRAKLSGSDVVDVSRTGNQVHLIAKVAGVAGNNIVVTTTNPAALAITSLGGGTDRSEFKQAQDKPDRPMNSVIQINFSEPINPVTISGSAAEVADYIRVVNASASSTPAGAVCSEDKQCLSYKCEGGVCRGDYLAGKFMVSNAYKTLEFISDKECGVNGCGEQIYCLPPNSHLKLNLVAANLKSCDSDTDCLSNSPYTQCLNTTLGYKTCQNPLGQNYPTANLSNLDGIVDAAANSFDGDRSQTAEGPLGFYNDNYPTATSTVTRDKYQWSFYIGDKINLTSPKITSISPLPSSLNVGVLTPVEVTFNTLMLNSSLRTGQVTVKSGDSTVKHKLINLRSSVPSPLGYWVESDNKDVMPLDGEPDITVAKISHTPFSESVTLISQIGSGVKDIYQNCYKPSAGPDCNSTAGQPSCCFGSPTATLGADGNCQ